MSLDFFEKDDLFVPAGGSITAPGDEGAIATMSSIDAAYGPYRALFDVSFTIPAGGVVALLGSNGSGKTTVARVLSGLVPSTAGSMSVAGTDATNLSAWRIARLGVSHVPEGRGVFSNLSVEENLTLVFRQRDGRKNLKDNLERAYAAFPILGERRKQLAGLLSGGQQRLLSLAKVLVVPSKLLIADELSLGLAPIVIDQVYEGLQEINRNGTALLVVEQHVDRVLNIANTAIVMDRGRVIFEGPADQASAVTSAQLARKTAASNEGKEIAEDDETTLPASD